MDWPDVWRTGMTRKTTMEGSSEDDQESLLVFIETRLHLGIPDTCHRHHSNGSKDSGKTRKGRTVRFYQEHMVHGHCHN